VAFEAEGEKMVEALTPARILNASRRRIPVESLSSVSACDFKKASLTS